MSDEGTFRVRRFTDPAAFLAHAEDWLLRHEAENNLILGIAHQLAAGTLLSRKPVYLATVEDDSGIVGCAFRTPPYKLGITRMPLEATSALVADIAAVYDGIPAVMGSEPAAGAIARELAALHHCSTNAGTHHRIYQLSNLIPPARLAEGAARVASSADAALAAQWIEEFSREAAVHTDNAAGLAAARIREHALYFWEADAGPVAMAAWSGQTRNGRRVGYVYTPPHARRRGYATSLVAKVSSDILAQGFAFCFLYTDLSNPTSNDIYQQIGYRPVCDVIDWNLKPHGATE